MRILKLDDFLRMPNGTVYMEYQYRPIGNLCIKEDTIDGTNEFMFQQLTLYYDGGDSEKEACDTLSKFNKGESVDLAFDCCEKRYGIDVDTLFAVFGS